MKNNIQDWDNRIGLPDNISLDKDKTITTNDDLPEPDFDDDFDNDNAEPDYYQCNSCGKIHGKRPMGGMCQRCDAYVEEGYY